ncbi:MAG TPA: hypothetical protein VIL32_05600 [Steroidobacteraceae bacterium]
MFSHLWRTVWSVTLVASMLSGCAVSGGPRAADSSLGCIRKVVDERMPHGLPDKVTHCIAAGLIAWHCSTVESGLASVGKELRDIFSSGNAEWADLQASRKGIACARRATDESALQQCCQ